MFLNFVGNINMLGKHSSLVLGINLFCCYIFNSVGNVAC